MYHAHSGWKFVVSERGLDFHAHSGSKIEVSEHGLDFHAHSDLKMVMSEHGIVIACQLGEKNQRELAT